MTSPEMTPEEMLAAYGEAGEADVVNKDSSNTATSTAIGAFVMLPFLAAYLGLLAGICGGICVLVFNWVVR